MTLILIDKGLEVYRIIYAEFLTIVLNVKGDNLHEDGTSHHILSISSQIPDGQDKALDLSNTTLLVHGDKVKASEAIDLIYADNGIHTDETTIVKGSDTFIFDTWQPVGNQDFTHELQLTDIESEKAISLISTSFASFVMATDLSVNKRSRFLNNYILEQDTGLFVSLDGSDIDYDTFLKINEKSYSLTLGYNFKLTDSINSFVFADLSHVKDCAFDSVTEKFGNSIASIDGDFDVDLKIYTLGTAFLFRTEPVDIGLNTYVGFIQSDYENNFYKYESCLEITDKTDFDIDRYYAGFSLNLSHHFELTKKLLLEPSVFYDFSYIEGGTDDLNNNYNNHVRKESSYVQSYGIGVDLSYAFTDKLSVKTDISYLVVDNTDGDIFINGYKIEGHDVGKLDALELGLGLAYNDDNFGIDGRVFYSDLDLEGYGFMLNTIFKF